MKANKKSPKLHYVYIITNLLLGTVYLGKSNTHLNRWKRHKVITYVDTDSLDFKTNHKYLHRCMKKYGIQNFSFEIIEYFNSEEEAYIAEKKFVKLFRANEKKFGMNLNSGGMGGMEQTQETKDKISQKRMGFVFSEESKKKMSESHKGQRPVWSRFSDQEVYDIRVAYIKNKQLKIKTCAELIKELSQKYTVSTDCIAAIVNGNSYVNLPIPNINFLKENEKVCTVCKQIKDKTKFSKAACTLDGLMGRCKPCDYNCHIVCKASRKARRT